MANIDLVPEFWKEASVSTRIMASKKGAVAAFAEWLDKTPPQQNRLTPRTTNLSYLFSRYGHILTYEGISRVGDNGLHHFKIVIDARPWDESDKSGLGLDSVFIANQFGLAGLHINDISFSKGRHDFELDLRCYGEFKGINCPKPEILLDECGWAQVGPTIAIL
jgi:hypothetical protein